MPEESTTTDPVELAGRLIEAMNRRDLDVMDSLFAPDAVWEANELGVTFEGAAAERLARERADG